MGIGIQSVNAAPVITQGATYTLPAINMGQSSTSVTVSDLLAAVGYSDADAGALKGITVVGGTSNEIWQIQSAGDTGWGGPFNPGNYSDSTTMNFRDTLSLRVFGAYTGSTYTATLRFRAWDKTDGAPESFSSGGVGNWSQWSTGGNLGGTSAYSSQWATISITINAIPTNTAPTLTGGTSTFTGTAANVASVPKTVNQMLADTGYGDSDSGALKGVAVTATSGLGTWQYSTDTVTWTSFGAVSGTAGLLLEGASSVRYVGDGSSAETATFTFRAWDQTSGTASTNGTPRTGDTSTNGGSSAFSTGTATAQVVVSAVNHAPTMSAGGVTLSSTNEDTTGSSQGVFAFLMNFSASDADGDTMGIAVIGTTGNGTWQFSSTGGSTWAPIGAVSGTSALLLGNSSVVRYVPDGANGETARITLRAWDQTSGTASTNAAPQKVDASTNGGSSAFSVDSGFANQPVTSVNDAPVIDWTMTIMNGVVANTPSPSQTVGTILSATGYGDVDTGAAPGMAVILKTGVGTWQYATDGVSWTDVGSVSESSALLLDGATSVRYQGDGHTGETPRLYYLAWDQTSGTASANGAPNRQYGNASVKGGTTAFSTITAIAQINVTAVNWIPVLARNTGLTLNEGGTSPVDNSMLRVTDNDNTAGQLILTVGAAPTQGTLYKNGSPLSSGGTFTQANIDGNLISYTHNGGEATSDSFSFTVSDGSGGTIGSTTFSITVSPVNDAPTLSGGPYSFPGITEKGTGSAVQVSNLLAALTYGDVDSGAQSGIAVTGNVGNGNWQYSPDGVTYNQIGTVSNTSALLLSGGMYIRYMPDRERGETATLTFRAWDRTNGSAEQKVDTTTNGGTTAFSTGTASAQIAVSDVNDYPSVTVPGAKTMDEDTSLTITGISISDVDAGNSIIRVTVLSFPLGDSVTLATTTGLTFVSGANGGDTYTVNGTMADINAALASLTYQPPANYTSTAFVQINVNDLGNTGVGGNLGYADIVEITINPVNDAPVFIKGANQTVNEDAVAQTVTGWATGIGPGGDTDEAGQTLTWNVTNDNNALFSVQPSLNASGDLSYTPAANATGTATVTVTLRDNGGTANGGSDISAPQAFTITVTGVNDAPSFAKGGDETVLEDAGAQTTIGWATGISKGPADEAGQTLTFSVTNDNNPLFAVQPAIAPNGDLTYTPAADANGSATVTVSLSDSGGTANGGVDTSASQTFAITVNPVNDAPSFTKGADLTIEEDPGKSIPMSHSVPRWATGMSTGPSDESGQTFSFTVTSDNPFLFGGGAPQVDTNGDLTYMLGLDANGIANVTVTMVDDGGTANGGANSFSQTFTVTVSPVNDTPEVTVPGPASVVQDTNLSLSRISVFDLDALDPGTVVVEVSLSTLHGTVSLATTSGLTFSAGDGSADPTMTFAGASRNVNAALATVTYRSNPSYSGSETLTVSVNDLGNTGSGGPLTDSKTVAITVTARPDDDGGSHPAPQPTPAPTQAPVVAPGPTQVPQPTATPVPTSTPVPTGEPSPSPTPVLVVVTPAPTVPVSVVKTDIPAGLPTPGTGGVVAVVSGDSRGVGVISATPEAWGGASVEIRVDNEGAGRAVVFEPFLTPPMGAVLPRSDAVIRSFSLEVYNYDANANSATHRTDEEKATAAPVTIRLAVSPEELAVLGADDQGRPLVSRFELLRVRPDGGVEAVPSTYLKNDGIQPPAGWVVATFVPRSTYLLIILREGEKSRYGVLRQDQPAWVEVSYADGGRYFPETGYSVKRDSFWDYFKKRGGIRTFGYPVSNELNLDGFTVQLFQRGAMQERPEGSVATINLLDESLKPALVGLEGFPEPDKQLIDGAPTPADPDYGRKAIEFVLTNVGDELDGERVGFLDAYMGTVAYRDAFPMGEGNADLMPLINLEVWGLPTSKPVRDPRNHDFVYQRFQRGILHYDATTGATQGILLGDAWKTALTRAGAKIQH